MDRLTLTMLVSFVACTSAVGVLTWWLTRRVAHTSSEGFFLAGRVLTGGYIAGSLLLTNLSTEQLVGLNGNAYADGLSVMAWEVIAAFALVMMAWYFLPRYLRLGVATVPQFLEARSSGTARTVATLIFLLAYALILLPIILYTGARGLTDMLDLQSVFGIESEKTVIALVVVFIGILGGVYALFGGLHTVAVSDTLNGFLLLAGGLLITCLGLAVVGDGQPLAGLVELYEKRPAHFRSIGTAEQSVPFSTLFTGVLLLNLFYWCTNQQIIQRAFAADSLAEGQRGVLVAGVFKVATPLILVIPGIVAFHLYSSEKIAQDQAYGRLVREVLPAPLAGFFAAAVVGAVLSSFNSVLNSTATLFSLGIYQRWVQPSPSEREVIRAGKVFGWLVAIVAVVAAPSLVGKDSIFGYLQKMNGIYFIPIFAVVLVGMISKRTPAWAAEVALALGVTAIALGYFVPPLAKLVDRMHEYHFLGAVFAGLLLVLGAGRVLAPRAEPWKWPAEAPVDMTPWRFSRLMGMGIIVMILTIYLAFAW